MDHGETATRFGSYWAHVVVHYAVIWRTARRHGLEELSLSGIAGTVLDKNAGE
jgi:hypothetical protein